MHSLKTHTHTHSHTHLDRHSQFMRTALSAAASQGSSVRRSVSQFHFPLPSTYTPHPHRSPLCNIHTHTHTCWLNSLNASNYLSRLSVNVSNFEKLAAENPKAKNKITSYTHTHVNTCTCTHRRTYTGAEHNVFQKWNCVWSQEWNWDWALGLLHPSGGVQVWVQRAMKSHTLTHRDKHRTKLWAGCSNFDWRLRRWQRLQLQLRYRLRQ